MEIVRPSTFGLHDDVPETDLDADWRALVRQQAQTLAALLQRLQTVARGFDAIRLRTVATATERGYPF